MFWTVVRDGALLDRGMPQYADLTPDQMVQLYAYIRHGAREAIRLQGGGVTRAATQATPPNSPAPRRD
jgi:hypothetical protein